MIIGSPHLRAVSNSGEYNFIEYKKEIDKLVDSLKVEYDGLSISVTKEFQKEEMKSFLESRCNLRGIERQQYIANLVS